MKEETWFKMVVLSALLHVIIVSAFSIPFHRARKTVDLTYYSVNLVGDIGPATGTAGQPAAAEREKPSKAPIKETIKKKETLQPKEKVRSITPVKQKEKSPEPLKKREVTRTTREEVSSLDETIRRMQRRVQNLSVGGDSNSTTGGRTSRLAGTAGGGTIPMDAALARYNDLVFEKIQEAWRPSGLSYNKDLMTIVDISVRRDGIIVDMRVEKRSGNRAYDESALRCLRSIDRLPPIPNSVSDDDLPYSMGIEFHPTRSQ